MTDRYRVDGAEGAFEPGSGGAVLRNLLGITSVDDMNDLELSLLAQLYEDVLLHQMPNRQLTADDLRGWHRRWLGNVYAWARDRSGP